MLGTASAWNFHSRRPHAKEETIQAPEPLPVAPHSESRQSPSRPVRRHAPLHAKTDVCPAYEEESPELGNQLAWTIFGIALLAFGAACGFEYGFAQARKTLIPLAGSMIFASDRYSVHLQASRTVRA